MRAIVAVPFRDRETWRVFVAGEEYEGTNARVSELAEEGLVKPSEMEATEDLSALSVAQLKALCDERGIDYQKKATKAQLLKLLGE